MKGVCAFRTIPILLLSLCLLESCGRPAQDSASTGKVQVRFAYWASPEVNEIYQQVIKRFEDHNPDIDIVPELNNQGYLEKLLMAIAGNAAPDIMVTEIVFFRRLAEKDVLVDLTPFVERDPNISENDYQPLVLDEFKWKDRIYSLPFGVGTYAMFYNKDLLLQAGLKPLPDTWDNDWWDWATFLEYSKKLTLDKNGDGRIDQYGFATDNNLWDVEFWLYQNGGEIMDDDGSKCLMDSLQAIDAVQFLVDLSTKYGVAPSPERMQELGNNNNQLFELGQVALYPSGYWRIGEFWKIPNLNWGLAPLPKGKTKATGWHAAGLSIWSGSKNTEEAWRFIEFINSPEIQLFCAKLGLQVPARISIASSSEFLNMKELPSNIGIFNEGFEYARRFPCIHEDARIQSIIDEQLASAWNGLRPVPDVCREISGRINARIEKRKGARG